MGRGIEIQSPANLKKDQEKCRIDSTFLLFFLEIRQSASAQINPGRS